MVANTFILFLAAFLQVGHLTQAYASDAPPSNDCATIDLQAPKNSPLRRMPVRDQDSTGTCYAQAGADLLNYQMLRKKGPQGKLKNPLHMALLSRIDTKGKYKEGYTDTSGGSIHHSINNSLLLGACSEESSKAAFDELRGVLGGELTDAQILGRLEFYLQETPKGSRNKGLSGVDACTQDRERRSLDAFLTSKGLEETLLLDILKDLFQECSRRSKRIRDLGTAEEHSNFDDALGSKLISALLRDGDPVGIAIASRVLINPQNHCVQFDPASSERKLTCNATDKEAHFLHAVSLIGQKVIDGKCHYLVRNSWGGSWRAKKADGTPQPCACNYVENPEKPESEYQSTCKESTSITPSDGMAGEDLTFDEADLKGGYAESYTGCWVPREAILGNLLSVTVLR